MNCLNNFYSKEVRIFNLVVRHNRDSFVMSCIVHGSGGGGGGCNDDGQREFNLARA